MYENPSSIPEHMRFAVINYVCLGKPIGGFLTSLLSNDFYRTCTRADGINNIRLVAYAQLLNYLPGACWGSEETVGAWQEKRRDHPLEPSGIRWPDGWRLNVQRITPEILDRVRQVKQQQAEQVQGDNANGGQESNRGGGSEPSEQGVGGGGEHPSNDAVS